MSEKDELIERLTLEVRNLNKKIKRDSPIVEAMKRGSVVLVEYDNIIGYRNRRLYWEDGLGLWVVCAREEYRDYEDIIRERIINIYSGTDEAAAVQALKGEK